MSANDTTPMTTDTISSAYTKQRGVRSGMRPPNSDLDAARDVLSRIVQAHKGKWMVSEVLEKCNNAMSTLHNTVTKQGRENEHNIVSSRKQKKYYNQTNPTETTEGQILSDLESLWDNCNNERSRTTAINKTVEAATWLAQTSPVPTSLLATSSFDWDEWSNPLNMRGMGGVMQRLQTLECDRFITTMPQDTPRPNDAAIAGAVFSKSRGSRMQGLSIVDSESGLVEWVSSKERLTKLLEEAVQHASRSKLVSGKGQTLICGQWSKLLTTGTTMWNGTKLQELIYDHDQPRAANYAHTQERWTTQKELLQKLHDDITSVINTVVVGNDTPVQDNTIINRRCNDAGLTLAGRECNKTWLADNATELSLCIEYIDTHPRFLFDCVTTTSDHQPLTFTEWQELDKGPQYKADVISIATSMNVNKSHCTLAPEHLVHGGDTLAECYLYMSKPYFAGTVPTSMCTGVVTALYKTASRFRPVTSIPLCYQLCEQTHSNREGMMVVNHGSSRQFGGVKGRGAAEPLQELQLLIADAAAHGKNLTIIYSDKTGAYDSINPAIFPVVYGRWHCPNHISSRMASVASNHLRVVRTITGTKVIELGFPIECGDPLATAEDLATYQPYVIQNSDTEILVYSNRHYMDDAATLLSTNEYPTVRRYPEITHGATAAAIAGGLLCIENNGSKTKIMNTIQPKPTTAAVELTSLTNGRLRSITLPSLNTDIDFTQPLTGANSSTRDLGTQITTTTRQIRGMSALPQKRQSLKAFSQFKRAATAHRATTSVTKMGIQSNFIGMLRQQLRVMMYCPRDTWEDSSEDYDTGLAKIVLQKLQLQVSGLPTETLSIVMTPYEFGGLGVHRVGAITAGTMITELAATMIGTNAHLQHAYINGIQNRLLGQSENMMECVERTGISIHRAPDTATEALYTSLAHGDKMLGISGKDICKYFDCHAPFPGILFRILRSDEYTTDQNNRSLAFRLVAKMQPHQIQSKPSSCSAAQRRKANGSRHQHTCPISCATQRTTHGLNAKYSQFLIVAQRTRMYTYARLFSQYAHAPSGFPLISF